MQSSSAGFPQLLVAIYRHSRTMGTGRGFLVIAGIALVSLMIPVAAIRVRREAWPTWRASPGEPAEIRRSDAIWGLCLRQLMAELRTRVIHAVPCAAMVCLAPVVVAIETADAHALDRSCWLQRLTDHEAA